MAADDQGVGQAVQAPPAPPENPATQKSSSASRRVRARLARRMTAQRSAVNPVLEPLVAVHKEIYPKADLTMLQRAYEVAEETARRAVPPLRRSRTSLTRWPSRTSSPNSAWTRPR